MTSTGIPIDIEITYNNEKRSFTKYTSGILVDIRITFNQEKRS